MTSQTSPATADLSDSPAEESGYRKLLSHRQIQMIGVGGAIGTGLFLGTGGRIASAGPGLALVYMFCGFFAFLILRALGELVLHRPSSGSFVSYAREFYGEKAAFVSGWVYSVSWALTAIVDITAVAVYVHYWSAMSSVPQWLLAFGALLIVTGANLVSVRFFGEMEFWFALVKVVALILFLLVGGFVLGAGFPVRGHEPGISLIADNGGLMPHGMLPMVIVIQGIVFAYSGIELIGVAAGETARPEKVMPRAVNAVVLRIAVFYVGSTALLALLLPYTSYKAGESPFVTFFQSLGVPGVGGVMNLVVLTAALSSLNAGLYSTGRIYRSMAHNGTAPAFMARMSRNGVPYGGVLFTSALALFGGRAERRRPEDGLRDHAQRDGTRHPVHLGNHRPVPAEAAPVGATGPGEPAGVPHARVPVDLLPHAGLPGRSSAPDGFRLPRRHVHRRNARPHRTGPGRRLVLRARPGPRTRGRSSPR